MGERRVQKPPFPHRLSAMKSLARHAITAAALTLIPSCAIPNLSQSPGAYTILTRDGRQVMCDGEPVLQESTGYYRYRTPEKRDAVIRQDDVASIQKRSV